MKFIKMIPIFTLLVTSTFILSGCAVDKQLPTPAPGALTVDIQPASEVHIVQASARQVGEEVIVDGKIQRKKIGGRGIVKGHVDIDVLDEKGQTLRQVVTGCSPQIIPKLSGVRSSFTARIPMTAPPESIVRVTFHNGPHDGLEIL